MKKLEGHSHHKKKKQVRILGLVFSYTYFWIFFMRIAIWGINGKMGQALLCEIKNYNDVEVVFGVDNLYQNYETIVCYTDASKIKEKVDVIIDFSNHNATFDILSYALKTKTPVIFCSTSQNENELSVIKNASKTIPILLSPNMSFGANFMLNFAQTASNLFLSKGFSVDISETHHNAKLERPSGTAKSILNAILSVCPNLSVEETISGKRNANEICMHSFRIGSESGTHNLIFSNDYETITLSHKVYSRNVFAKGALDAAYKIINKNHGLYSMKNIDEKCEENIKN